MFIDDVELPGALHAAFLRSQFAHARIESIQTSAAEGLPGVVAVITASALGSLRTLPVLRPHPGLGYPAGPQVLAHEVVRYVGEPVAMVLAENRYLAEDAVEEISVTFEPLEVVADPSAAEAETTALVHEWMPSNVAGRFIERVGDPEAALAVAPVRVAFECVIGRGSAQPMETRGVAAVPDRNGVTVWINTQRPRDIRILLADYLELPVESVHLRVPDTGGSFGSKAYLYSEDLLVPWAALQYRRPVRWTEDRLESFLGTYPEHEQRFEVEIGSDEDGLIRALRVRLLHDLGAYSPYGLAVCQNTADHVAGPYRIPHLEFECRAVYTNKTPSAPYRGAGRPQGVLVVERAMDALARELGLDPAEVRRRNLIRPGEMPYDTGLDTPGGRLVYDSGDYPRCLDIALRESEYAAWRARQRRMRGEGRLIGVGIANYVECSITQPHESAKIRLLPDGSFQVSVGVSAQGQGHETVFARVAADALGVDPAAVSVVGAAEGIEDTLGTYASRSAIMVGSAVRGAATALASRVVEVAAELLGTDPGTLSLSARGVVICEPAPTREIPWARLARLAEQRGTELEAGFVFRSSAWHVANGTHIAVVEVNPSTGHVSFLRYVIVHDAGRILDRGVVEGQILGGAAQGIAGALMEELVYDEHGQLLTGSLMDYLLPTSADVPSIAIQHVETPSPHNPLGAKGAGEGGILPTYAVVISAVEDAIGVPLHRVPITPQRVMEAVRRSAHPELQPVGSL